MECFFLDMPDLSFAFLQIFLLTKKAAEIALGYPLTSLISISADSQPARRADGDLRQGLDSDPRIDVKDLLLGETVGTGQFGLVKIAHMKRHPELYALKVYPSLILLLYG